MSVACLSAASTQQIYLHKYIILVSVFYSIETYYYCNRREIKRSMTQTAFHISETSKNRTIRLQTQCHSNWTGMAPVLTHWLFQSAAPERCRKEKEHSRTCQRNKISHWAFKNDYALSYLNIVIFAANSQNSSYKPSQFFIYFKIPTFHMQKVVYLRSTFNNCYSCSTKMRIGLFNSQNNKFCLLNLNNEYIQYTHNLLYSHSQDSYIVLFISSPDERPSSELSQ